ncbi:MAG: MarR family transcriptional regulator [Terrimicrobiaceae bacterium]|nr:MarR family transcriptional regulator [Terrimicrobiaceae bacterium]
MSKEIPRHAPLLEAARSRPEFDAAAYDMFVAALNTGEAVSEVEARYLAEHRITPGRFAVMLLLGVEESITRKPSELADLIGVTRATMTGLLDTLERDHYVGRAIDPSDRRSMRVESTPACRELLKKVLPGYFRLVATIPATLTEEERAEFIRLSRKLQDGLHLAGTKLIEQETADQSAPPVAVAYAQA